MQHFDTTACNIVAMHVAQFGHKLDFGETRAQHGGQTDVVACNNVTPTFCIRLAAALELAWVGLG